MCLCRVKLWYQAGNQSLPAGVETYWRVALLYGVRTALSTTTD